MRTVSRRALAGLALLPLSIAAGCGGGGHGGGGAAPFGSQASGGASFPPGPAVVVADGTGGTLLSPFPDDRFTVADPGSPTGLRLQLPVPTTTTLERRFADNAARLAGFGVLAPICVTFDDALDPATITDQSVLVVNVEPGSPRAGEVAALDLGRGSYPTDLGRPMSFYARDPLAAGGDLSFPPGNPAGDYEAGSRTLILRPLRPLEEGARHAVLLTAGLRGASGNPVSPPAGYARPTAYDATLGPILAAQGATLADVRYQWTFTTGTPTLELRAVADGLDGAGPLAAALAAFPPRLERFDDLARDLGGPSPYTLDVGVVGEVTGALAAIARAAAPLDPKVQEFASILELVDLSAAGSISTGSILDADLRASPDSTWQVDLAGGAAPAKQGRVTFLLIVPKPCAANNFAQPPYPVILSGHGNGRSRIDGLGVASAATRNGWAVLAFDAVGHGPDDALTRLPQSVAAAASGNAAADAGIRALILGLALVLHASVNPFDSVETQLKSLLQTSSLLRPLAEDGRATDVDGDGYTDSGATFFTADVFTTRDIVRQTAADVMALARVFRAGVDPRQSGSILVGGQGAAFAYTGISLGGINGSVIMGADPLIARADLMVPGGGFTDIVTNSQLESVTQRVLGEVYGEVVLGDPDGAGGAFVDVDRHGRQGHVPTAAGGHVAATNVRTGLGVEGPIATDGGFRVHLAVDAGDPVEVDSFDGSGAPLGSASFAAPADGLGFERATPPFREWVGLAALALEAADPACYGPFWLAPGAGRPVKKVLMQVSLGDFTVPVFTGATLGRAAGLISNARQTLLIQQGVTLGGISSNVDRVFGVESTHGAGIRFLGVDNHAGMLVPNPRELPESAQYTAAAQAQAFEFLATGVIDDSNPIFDTILPP
jgi:hypothetical protein